MSSLYRKYRPQSFSEVIGQNHIKITLQHEIERNEIGHAYLFCGPRGLGKTTSARLLAKSINCENRKDGESEPCNKCSSCLDIMANRSVDIIEIDAASNTGVDNVRENIIESSRFTPTKSKYKVFIIDEVHMLSTSAFNALLKILEEPPQHVIFVLCTTEIYKIPLTIISRCQRFDFKKVSADNLFKRLEHIVKEEGKQIDDEVLKRIVINSDGCVRDAESLLGKLFSLGDKITLEQAEIILPKSDFGVVVEFLQFIAERNSTAGIELINKLVEGGVDLQIFTDNLIEFLRKILLIKVNEELDSLTFELSDENQRSAKMLAERFAYAQILSMIELFLVVRRELPLSSIAQFPLEVAVVQLNEEIVCQREDDFSDRSGGNVGGGENIRAKIKSKIDNITQQAKDRLEAVVGDKAVKDVPAPKFVSQLIDEPVVASELQNGPMLELDDVRKKWGNIIEKLLEKNYTLAALCKISQPLKCKDNVLELGVKSKFYQDRINDLKNKKIVDEAISEVLGFSVSVKGIICADLVPLEVEIKEPAVAGTSPAPATQAVRLDAVQDVMNMF
ncbi:MAG: DNA polymerase III subunit gamma/tau [Patescibacteria group bacterium]